MLMLATMLMLITAGTATLTSALSTANINQNQSDIAQIDLFAQAIRYTFEDMLNDTAVPATSNNLQTEIVTLVYANADDADITLYDGLSISLDEPLSDGSIKTHLFECTVDMTALRVNSSGDVSGLLTIIVKIDAHELRGDNPASRAEYVMSFALDSATGDSDGLTSYGRWELQRYAKIEA